MTCIRQLSDYKRKILQILPVAQNMEKSYNDYYSSFKINPIVLIEGIISIIIFDNAQRQLNKSVFV